MAVDPKSRRKQGAKPVKPPVIDLKAEEVAAKDKPVSASKPAEPKAGGEKSAAPKPVGTKAAKSETAETNQSDKKKPEETKTSAKVSADNATKPAPEASSAGALFMAGAAGAIAGAAVALAMSAFMGGDDPQAVQQEVSALVTPIREQLDATRAELETLQQITQSAPDPDALRGDISATQEAVQALQQRADSLDERISVVAATDDGGAADSIAALQTVIDQLTSDIAALKSVPVEGGTAIVPPELTARIEALESALQQGDADQGEAVSVLGERVTALEEGIAAIETRLRDHDADLQTMGSRPDAAAARQVGQALALASLREAVARGGPFADELATLQSLWTDGNPMSDSGFALTSLETAASTGVANAVTLSHAFDARVSAVLTAARQDDEGGIVQRLVGSVVTVRQVGDGGGSTPDALVAQIERALARGDTTAAHDAWQALPEPARAAAPDFGSQLDARAQADAALAALTQSVTAQLEGDGS